MYPPDPWQEISANAIDLINNFLWVQQRYRFTSGKSLIHPWLENFQTWVDLRSLEGAAGERFLPPTSQQNEGWKRVQAFRETAMLSFLMNCF